MSTTDPNGSVTQFAFDTAGNMASLTDPVNNTTQWFYDHAGRMVEEKNALGASRYFAYTADGDLSQKTDRNGRVTEYAYDFLRRRTSETWLDGETAVRTFSFAYNLAGDLLTASDPAASYTYSYDNLGRAISITQEIDGLTPTIVMNQDYDILGPRSQVATTIGGTADFLNAYTLDDFGRLLRITQSGATGGNAVAEKRVDFAYDAANQFTTITRYNNLAGTQLVAQSAHTFDGAGRLTTLAHAKGAATLASHAWTWDAGSRITSYTNSVDGSVTYTNDPASQLTGAAYTYQPSIDDETYVYDANGNRTNNGYTVGVNNRLTSDGVNTYTYDAEGNRLTRTNSTTGAVTQYAWDYRNRLTSVTERASANGPGTKLTEHAYDHENRWLRRVVHPDGDTGSEPIDQTIFAYDALQIALHWSTTGSGDVAASNLSNRYLWGANVDQILADEQVTSLETPGSARWPLCDRLNTVRDLAAYDVGTDTTAVSNHRVYGVYGLFLYESDPAVACLVAFTARPFDSQASLQNNLSRWYDLQTGQWITEDPIGYNGSLSNLYEYVSSNPLLYVDPSGQIVLCGTATVKCRSGNVEVPVYGESARAAAVLALDPTSPPNPTGCYTLLTEIQCTFTCAAIKTTTVAGRPATKAVPILEHEACHYCLPKDMYRPGSIIGECFGLLCYLCSAGPAPDACVGNERPATPNW